MALVDDVLQQVTHLTNEEVEQSSVLVGKALWQLNVSALSLLPELFRLKSHAFREEREWRLLSYLVKVGEDRCSHRTVQDRIVPYREIELVELQRGPIAEIILGPKHNTPPEVVEGFLKQNHYGDVRVKRSGASYR